MNPISEKQVKDIHFSIIHNNGMIQNALESAFASVDYYSDVKDKIASIVRSLIKNHYFADGNKRTALIAYALLCKMNNLPAKLEGSGKLIEDIAANNYSVEQIKEILF